MKRIVEYATARDSNLKGLDKIVNELIEQGFQPFGSPYLTDGDEFLACQAMVKYEKGTEGF
jgi:hypothetical protein